MSNTKRKAMSAGLFFGILLILIGISLVLKVVFHVDFPVGKFLIAFIFIYIGIKILAGGSFKPFHPDGEENTVIFGEKKIKLEDLKYGEYNTIFGSCEIDLTDLDSLELDQRLNLNTIFGQTTLLLSEDNSVEIEAETVFGNSELPNQTASFFGDVNYSNAKVEDEKPLKIKSDVVFGSFKVIQK